MARESHNLPSGHLLIFKLKGTTSLPQFLPLKVFEGAGGTERNGELLFSGYSFNLG